MLEEKLLLQLREYVEKHLNKQLKKSIKEADFNICESQSYELKSICRDIKPYELEDFIKNNRQQTFNQVLFSFIDKKGATDLDVYKKAGIDRRHFSKIRSNPDYRIGKNTAIALAMALELNTKETEKLLSSAGYSLSDSDTFDLVIKFCLGKKIYNLQDVNQALDYFSLKPLAGALE